MRKKWILAASTFCLAVLCLLGMVHEAGGIQGVKDRIYWTLHSVQTDAEDTLEAQNADTSNTDISNADTSNIEEPDTGVQETNTGADTEDTDAQGTAEDAGQGAVAEDTAEEIPESSQEDKNLISGLTVQTRGMEISFWTYTEGEAELFLSGFAREAELVFASEDHSLQIFLDGKKVSEGETLNASLEEQKLEILSEEGEQLWEGNLNIRYGSDLPVINLETQSGTLSRIQEDREAIESAVFSMLTRQEDGTVTTENIAVADEIRTRGNSTWALEKKSYQIHFEEKQDLCGMGAARTWLLLANGYDETQIRNSIAFEMAEYVGMAYTPESVLVDLYSDGEYQGVYLLCEKIQVAENRLNIADLDDANKARGGSREIVISEDGTMRYTTQTRNPSDITGGYLLERDLKERYLTENSGFQLESGDCYVLKSPEYATQEQVTYIRSLMQEAEDAIYASDGINPDTGKHYSEYIDVDSFVKKYLLEEVTKNYDGGVTSAYYYKPQDDVSTKIFAGPAWDYDVIFGNCTLDEINSNPQGVTELLDHTFRTELYAALMEHEDFRQQVFSCYEESFRPFLINLTGSRVDEYVEKTSDSVKMNHIRWLGMENRYQYYSNYEDSIRYLKYFMDARRQFLDEVWMDGEIYWRITLHVGGFEWRKLYVKDGAVLGELPIPYQENSLFAGWYFTKNGKKYDPYRPVFEDMSLEAKWQDIQDSQSG